MRVYEEYQDPQEKRKAQRGAKRGIATGKARGYVLVFNEDGIEYAYGGERSIAVYNGLGELFAGGEPGDLPRAMVHCTPSIDFLRNHCRSVGFETIPQEWKVAFASYLNNCLQDDGERKRYRKVLRHKRHAQIGLLVGVTNDLCTKLT